MRRTFLALTALACFTITAQAQSTGLGAGGELVDPDYLRVCADPSSLPFSNDKGEGFENKLAELFAKKLGRKDVQYTWYPMATGFVRKTLGEHRCDIIMGYPQGDELVQNTNAYYRTTYAIVFKAGSPLEGIETLEDPRLKGLKLGVIAGTPPATSLAVNGLIGNAKSYQLMVDTRIDNPSLQMIQDISSGAIDGGLLWGPIAGYYAMHTDPPLKVVPLVHEGKSVHMIYRITMGVRATDQEWKRQLNKTIRENQKDINAIMLQYGVPLLDEQDKAIVQ